MNEEWRDVVGYEEYYRVSNLGQVWSKRSNREIVGGVVGEGGRYRQITFSVHGIESTKFAHNIVMEAFVGPPPENMEVNHIDGDKLNNRLDNLEYVTHSDNVLHAFKLGLSNNQGENHPGNKLTKENVMEIRSLIHNSNLTLKAIGDMFNVTKYCIWDIKHKRSWNHI